MSAAQTKRQLLLLPVAMGIMVLIVTVFFWRLLALQHEDYINQITKLQLESAKHEIYDRLDTKILGLRRMALRWESRGGTPKQEWEQDALSLLSDFKGFKAVGWVDDTYHIRWIVPVSGNKAALDYDLSSDRICKILLENSRKSRQIRVTPPAELVQGKKGFLVFVPISLENSFGGFIIGVFDHKSLFESMLQYIAPDYSISVSEGRDKIYSREELDAAGLINKWASASAINIYGIKWDVSVCPTSRQYIKLKSSVPELILIFGIILSLVSSLLVYLRNVLRLRARKLEAINKELEYELKNLKRAQEEINKLSLAVEENPTTIIITDINGNIEYVNSQFEHSTGYAKDEVIGKNTRILKSGEQSPEFYSNIWKTITGGMAWHGEFHNKKKNGQLYWEYASVSPLKNSDGVIINFVGVMQDITERKRSEEWLKKSNETIKGLYSVLEVKNKELEKLDQLKSDFISTVSHELRTPLAVTKEAISLILDQIVGPVSPQQEKFLVTARNNIDRLALLINDLLDISKIESGKIELKREIVNIVDIVKNACSFLEQKARAKGLELKSDFEKDSIFLYVDSDKITQIFTNLVNNAIKFTQNGNISVAIKEEGDCIRCEVADTGIGIAEQDLPYVFVKFKQFAKAEYSSEKGTGLGLSITKAFIELHGGRIMVESTLGAGTKFLLIIPKLTVKDIFKKHIASAIKQSEGHRAKLSILVISMSDFEKVSESLGNQNLKDIAGNIEHVIKSNLHKTTDVLIKEKGEFLVILSDCSKENALRIQLRFTRALNSYLTAQKLSESIKLSFGTATYPDDASTGEGLLEGATKNKWFVY